MNPNHRAFFLPVANGQRFCVYHPPQGTVVRGRVVYAHPFAEELNKTRRMAALQAQALAQHGYAVLQIDLLGCGDSSGDFADARWALWINDLLHAHTWLLQQPTLAQAPLWLWGLRAGCLLASDAAQHINTPCHLLFWQAMPTGSQVLQQFLRLDLAGALVTGNAAKPGHSPGERLSAGEPVTIAGYTMAPDLASGLAQARLVPAPQQAAGQLVWLETSTHATPALSPAAARALAPWQEAGWAVHSQAVQGPAFWHTAETTTAPALLAATCAAMAQPNPAA